MDWSKVFLETLSVSYSTISKMTLIIIPLVIAIECMKDMGWMEKLANRFQGVTRLLRLPGETVLGLIVGLFVGLLFGSGVIIEIAKEVKLTRNQMNIFFVFIGICHAVIEETIIFTSVGANGVIILLGRALTAVIFTFMYIRITTWTAGIKGEQGLEIKSGE